MIVLGVFVLLCLVAALAMGRECTGCHADLNLAGRPRGVGHAPDCPIKGAL